MRKTKLVIEHELEGNVLGIVSPLKDYKLAWHINQVFKIDLVMQPPLVIEFVSSADLSITNYLYNTEYQEYRLIRNRGSELNSGFLIPELINFDYFLVISGEKEVLPDQRAIDGLHSIRGIEYFQEIDVSRLKSKDNFIF